MVGLGGLALLSVLLLSCAAGLEGFSTEEIPPVTQQANRGVEREWYSVTRDTKTGKWMLENGLSQNWVAYGSYSNAIASTGWDTLSLTSSSSVSHMDQVIHSLIPNICIQR